MKGGGLCHSLWEAYHVEMDELWCKLCTFWKRAWRTSEGRSEVHFVSWQGHRARGRQRLCVRVACSFAECTFKLSGAGILGPATRCFWNIAGELRTRSALVPGLRLRMPAAGATLLTLDGVVRL